MAIKCVRNHGKKVWLTRIAFHGKRRARLWENREEAKAAEVELLQELTQEADQEKEEAALPVTLALLCDAYVLDLEARGKAPDSIVRAKDTTKRLADFFGPRMEKPFSMTEEELYVYRAWRMRQWAKRGKKANDGTRALLPGTAKASTVNRDLRTVRAMLKRAMPGFRFPTGVFLAEAATRVRWLKQEDEILIFATMPSPFGDIARLAAITMMRMWEIQTLRREHVDLAQGVVTLPRTKTVPRHVVLSAGARMILARALETSKGEYIFPRPDGRPYSRVHIGRIWRKAAHAAGLTDFHFHDLRHHGATMALNAGYSASIVMALGGWKTEAMMRRYAAVTDKTLRPAAEAVSGSEVMGGGGSYAIQRRTQETAFRTQPEDR